MQEFLEGRKDAGLDRGWRGCFDRYAREWLLLEWIGCCVLVVPAVPSGAAVRMESMQLWFTHPSSTCCNSAMIHRTRETAKMRKHAACEQTN